MSKIGYNNCEICGSGSLTVKKEIDFLRNFHWMRFVVLSANFILKDSRSQEVEKRDLSGYDHLNKLNFVDDYKDYVENGYYKYNDNEGVRSKDSKYYEKPPRRLFEWFSKLFKTTTTKSTYNTVVTKESSYERDLKERIFLKELYQNLTETLAKITEIHKHVSNVIKQREADTIRSKEKPHLKRLQISKQHHKLVKRDVSPENSPPFNAVSNEDSKLNNSNNMSEVTVNITSTECPCDKINNTSGRRFIPSFTPSEVKQKLLLYLKDSFYEINNKILSLKDIKEAFSEDYSFKIGYIIANIDALEVNLLNLKKNMEENKDIWDDKTILELFDTLKVSNQAMSGLTESLKLYIDRLASYNVQSI